VAGLTEGFITPWNLATVPAVVVGVILAGGFWSMVVWRGSPDAGGGWLSTGAPAA
jgi:hypothetical protein